MKNKHEICDCKSSTQPSSSSRCATHQVLLRARCPFWGWGAPGSPNTSCTAGRDAAGTRKRNEEQILGCSMHLFGALDASHEQSLARELGGTSRARRWGRACESHWGQSVGAFGPMGNKITLR